MAEAGVCMQGSKHALPLLYVAHHAHLMHLVVLQSAVYHVHKTVLTTHLFRLTLHTEKRVCTAILPCHCGVEAGLTWRVLNAGAILCGDHGGHNCAGRF